MIKLNIATKKTSLNWPNETILWSDFTARINRPFRKNITLDACLRLSKERQGRIKDVGAYVGGTLKGPRRIKTNIVSRQLITLDIDKGKPQFWDVFKSKYKCAALLHGTFNYTPEKPRYRLLIPLSKPVSPDRYTAIAQTLAIALGMEQFDGTTFQFERYMFWPAVPSDSVYYFKQQKGAALDPEQVPLPDLEKLLDNKDLSKLLDKQQDPIEKEGIVGQFCRTYDIDGAIETFLPDVYESTLEGNRYTYTAGSSYGGLILYNEASFAYSHHDTDPCSLKLCNAFDMVRLHLGKSFDEMSKFAKVDPRVKQTISQEKLKEMGIDFGDIQKDNPFPVHVFPKRIQTIISQTNATLNFPVDFTGASIMYALSLAIGNTKHIRIMNGYVQTAVVYIALVGRKGTNKSHPLKFILTPFKKRDGAAYSTFKKQEKIFETYVKLNAKQKKDFLIDNLMEDAPVKPFWKQNLMADATPEALADVHKNNTRGVGLNSDELAGWFKNFERYNKGSAEEFWLSAWSGSSVTINRVTAGPTYIEFPFIPVIGTVQPEVLDKLAENRVENGFLDRILFASPDNLKKEYWNKAELNPDIVTDWDAIISVLLENETDTPEVISFTNQARDLFFKWQRKITDISNNPENKLLNDLYAKLEPYALRLALILEMAFYGCGQSEGKVIGITAVKGAIELVEYFKNCAVKVHTSVSVLNPVKRLTSDKRALYKELPEQFITATAIEIAEKFGVSTSTFKRFLSDEKLFSKVKRGEYKKLF